MASPTQTLIETRLATLSPLSLQVDDESHLHAGHAGAREGGHFRVDIVAEAFAGLGTVARHRLVNRTIGDLRQAGIHALSIRARAPGEAV